jgi:hypothetical protein
MLLGGGFGMLSIRRLRSGGLAKVLRLIDGNSSSKVAFVYRSEMKVPRALIMPFSGVMDWLEI